MPIWGLAAWLSKRAWTPEAATRAEAWLQQNPKYRREPVHRADLTGKGLLPGVRSRMNTLLAASAEAGDPLRITSSYRSAAHQAQLQRTNPLAVSPRTSRHVQRRAFDAVRTGGGVPRWNPHGYFAWILGLRWGGWFRKRDPVHFDR